MPRGVFIRTKEIRLKLKESHIGRDYSKIYTEEVRKRMSGSNNYNWQGGVTPEFKKIRDSSEMKLWRKSILMRDNYTCQKTGIKDKGYNLVTHHIKGFSQFPELRFDPSNGITLSRKSHDQFHKIYGKKNNTREQLNEFLNTINL